MRLLKMSSPWHASFFLQFAFSYMEVLLLLSLCDTFKMCQVFTNFWSKLLNPYPHFTLRKRPVAVLSFCLFENACLYAKNKISSWKKLPALQFTNLHYFMIKRFPPKISCSQIVCVISLIILKPLISFLRIVKIPVLPTSILSL